jgi:hypothetical protein
VLFSGKNVAFCVKRRHFYFFSLPIPLFSLLIDKRLRQHGAISLGVLGGVGPRQVSGLAVEP